ncbi:MAG: DNA repair protein RecO [Deltaproteobacteria bacterium]|nr:DNA repair protein RecO [Deltaproteobacteria bacterium]
MSSFTTPAIMLRRIDFGDYDLIITFLTLGRGKIPVIVKSAKKSTKRFSGILELFSALDLVCSVGRRKGLPILQEATLTQPFAGIRSSIRKTAYASYCAELINEWLEGDEKQPLLYHLLHHVLAELDSDQIPEAALSILFQMRFMAISGLSPNLRHCGVCRLEMEKMAQDSVVFDLGKGGLICKRCATGSTGRISLSKGTIKQLQWIENGPLAKAERIRFSSQSLKEGLEFLETFVPYHLGKEVRSLKFLKQIR